MPDTLPSRAAPSLEEWHRAYPRKRPDPPAGVFELGLCMAGAVSAGAYTAGVLDFLIEALDAFEEEKKERRRNNRAPLHEVVIPVLGGASAGGMCAAIAAIFLDTRFPPVRADTSEEQRRRNPLYRAWVQEVDIRRFLQKRDVAGGAELRSLLDCTVLEEIVDGLLDERARSATVAHRPWLADPLRAVLTLANLRGVPYALRFEGSEDFRHWMSHHADHVRFSVPLDPAAHASTGDPHKVGETELHRDALAGSDDRRAFKAIALGTGSFPVALSPRILERVSGDYAFRAAFTPTGPFQDNTPVPSPEPGWASYLRPAWSPEDPRYRALCVDGGAMNNEPLDLVRRVLSGYGTPNPREPAEAVRTLLLVDPFVKPDEEGPHEARGLLGSIMPLFNALVANSRFKPEDLAMAADPGIGSRFLIGPSRGVEWKDASPIAAGHLGGFLGFFSEAYRRHDFLLGRRNAQKFLSSTFVLPEENPLFGDAQAMRWDEDARKLWKVEAPLKDGASPPGRLLPVIPLCGDRVTREEPLPAWPYDSFDAKEIRALVGQRAEVVLPALRDTLLQLFMGEAGFAARAFRTALRPLTPLLRGRVADKAMAAVQEAVTTLEAAPNKPPKES